MVGSPGDVNDEAENAIKIIHHWNSLYSKTHNIAIVPIHWKTSAYPLMDDEGQKIINQQLVNDSDAMVCIFGARLGTPTSTHISGTVEEIEGHLKNNKPVLLFFKKYIDPSNFEQYAALKNYKDSISNKCLYFEFDDLENFEKIFTEKLNLFVNGRFVQADKNLEKKNNNGYTEEEIEIMRNWCNGNNTLLHTINFEGGTSMYFIGNSQYPVSTAVEKLKMEDFIKRLEEDGYIKRDEKKHGNWTYNLTFLALTHFNE